MRQQLDSTIIELPIFVLIFTLQPKYGSLSFCTNYSNYKCTFIFLFVTQNSFVKLKRNRFQILKSACKCFQLQHCTLFPTLLLTKIIEISLISRKYQWYRLNFGPSKQRGFFIMNVKELGIVIVRGQKRAEHPVSTSMNTNDEHHCMSFYTCTLFSSINGLNKYLNEG